MVLPEQIEQHHGPGRDTLVQPGRMADGPAADERRERVEAPDFLSEGHRARQVAGPQQGPVLRPAVQCVTGVRDEPGNRDRRPEDVQ
jgi:hypothetical protein